MTRHRDVLPILLGSMLWILFATAPAAGADWPEFRGPDRDGISDETGLLASWPDDGPPELWRQPLGDGYSAISVVGDRLYTIHSRATEGDPEATEVAVAIDLDGTTLWSREIDRRIETEFGHGPRSTPTVVGDRVVVLGSHGRLSALGAEDGAVRWSVELTEEFGSQRPYWGFSASPLVVDGVVVVEAGGPDGHSYVGLDLATGELRWASGDTPGPGYNSPLLVRLGDERRIVYVAGEKLRVIDTAGREIASSAWPPGETHAIPLFLPPDRIYASGAGEVGAQVVRLNGGDGGVEPVWSERLMRNHFSAGVHLDGKIYAFDNATLKCMDAETAEICWAKRGLGKGSLIAADGHLLVLSDQGALVLAEASPDGFVEKGRVQALEGKSWTAPALADGRLYLRNHSEMVVYDLNAPAQGEAR